MKRLLRLLPILILAFSVGLLPIPALAAPQTHHLTLDMSQYEFEPGRLHINQGDTLVITLQAADVVHGFYLDGYGIQQRVEPGIDQEITFVSEQRGKFRFRCSVSCGPMHPFMIGELIVGPNTFFIRAISLTLLALIGTLLFIQNMPDRQFQEREV